MSNSTADVDEMWQRAAFLTRLVASAVRVAETAGTVIKNVTATADLKIVDKGTNGAKDLQTEADRSAQYCIEKSLQTKFNNSLHIIGEEEHTSAVPNLELDVSRDVLELNDKLPADLRNATPDDVVIWVDPLDGTTEFASAVQTMSPLLVQVTVLIGIAYKGQSVAGVIHQPFYEKNGRTIWAIDGVGTFGVERPKGQFVHPVFPLHRASAEVKERVVVTTRSHSTPLVQQALTALEEKNLYDRVERVGGAGYKVIKCLEGATAYVFPSAGCKKWDTAAPEACIKAAGGRLTDVSGRPLVYNADVQQLNSGGVLATAPGVDYNAFLNAIPADVKAALPEFKPKN